VEQGVAQQHPGPPSRIPPGRGTDPGAGGIAPSIAPDRPHRSPNPGARLIVALKVILWIACLTPAGLMVWDAFHGGLGANPIEQVTHRTGRWALILLFVSLGVTPVRRITGWNPIIRLRRPLGLFAFFYGVLHLSIYVGLDRFFDFSTLIEDVLKRPYITVGTASLLMLTALAATSTRGAVRRLGRNWQRLHWLVYPAAILGVLHFLWLVKPPAIRRPLTYAAWLAALLLLRFVPWRRLRGGEGSKRGG